MAKAKKLPSGMWRVLLYDGKDDNGKRKYKSFTAATKKQAEADAALYSLGPHHCHLRPHARRISGSGCHKKSGKGKKK